MIDAKFPRFALIGVVATLVHILVFVACVERLGVAPVLATIPSFLLATLVSYLANRKWTFLVAGDHQELLPKFVAVQVSGLVLNAAITFVFVDVLRLWYAIALAVCVAVVPLITFLLHRGWTFSASIKP